MRLGAITIFALCAPIFSLRSVVSLVLNVTAGDAANESFIFSICSIVLEETEWKYVSIVSFELSKVELSENFMKNFHNQVSPVVLSERETSQPSSGATLLISGNANILRRLLSQHLSLWVPEIFYIILFPRFPPDCEDIFKDLWNKHHVSNVLIIALHEPQKVVSYNQFFDLIIEEDTLTFTSNPINNVRKITRQKMSNMNGYPIRVAMFPTRVTAIPQPDGTYKGSDGIILQTLAKHMNFTPITRVPRDGQRYGWKQDNGTFTGALGEIVYNRVDVAFNAVFIKHYHTDNVQFTMPVHFDPVCFVVPKSTTKPQWKTVFLAFDSTIWISLLITYWISFIVWYRIKIYYEKTFDATLLGINLYGILLMIPVNRGPRICSERMIMLMVILFGFVVASSFQGSMIRYLAYETYEPDINTIEELVDAKLNIISASYNLKELIETDDKPIMARLKFSLAENKDILGEIATRRNGASIGRKSDLEEKIATSYVRNNQAQLHIVEQCPRAFHMAYLVPKNSPYIAIFNDIINYFVEAGITNSWFIHSKPFRPLSDYHESANQVHIVFTVENVIIAFIILIVGLTLSCFAFIVEVIFFTYQQTPNQ